jgi:hypothetical protein
VGVRVQRARPGGHGRWGFCSLETLGSPGKALFFLSLTTPADGGSVSPVTIATPFVIGGADFQHFFALALPAPLQLISAPRLTE